MRPTFDWLLEVASRGRSYRLSSAQSSVYSATRLRPPFSQKILRRRKRNQTGNSPPHEKKISKWFIRRPM